MRMLVLAGILVFSTSALADTLFSSGSMYFSGSVTTTTRCTIYNGGAKPIKISSVGIVPYDTVTPGIAADFDGCSTAYLPAGLPAAQTCSFTGTMGVYGGGFALVKGSTKLLRGNCTLYTDPGGSGLLTEPMR